MQSTSTDRTIMNQPTLITGMSPAEFFANHARPGRIGLVGGASILNRAITRVEARVAPDGARGSWSHAFVCEGLRADGHHWIVESDLEIHRRHIRLGVQENRALKYFDAEEYPRMAIFDFGLSPEQEAGIMGAALDLVARHTRYSVRELFGTLLALHRPALREGENRLARDESFYCSAFVRHLFRQVNLDLLPGVEVKHTTPGDLARSPLPHAAWMLDRRPKSPGAKSWHRLKDHLRGRLARGSSRRGRAADPGKAGNAGGHPSNPA